MSWLSTLREYIRTPFLVAGFTVGLLTLYTKDKDKRIVYVYPRPDNVERIQYRDLSGQCFEVVQEPVPCNVVTQFPALSKIKEMLPQM